ncbi:MAG: exosortase C-terminal domain/associated protein EpsI [Rubrivivax sp.]
MSRRHLVAGAVLLGSLPTAEALRPRRRRVDAMGTLELERDLPLAFGNWRNDDSIRPLLPDPAQQELLAATYHQVLARTMQRLDGVRVMLSVAYGVDQGGEATAVHRPEFCYRGQGFAVRPLGDHRLELAPGVQVPVRRLFATQGPRREAISYWLTLGQVAALPGLGRRLAQWREGLSGWIADGLIFRLSTLGEPSAEAFEQHADCARSLWRAVGPERRARYFGSGAESGGRA